MKLKKEVRQGLYTTLMDSLVNEMKERTYQKMCSLLEDAEPETAPAAPKKENKKKVQTVKKEKFLKDNVTLIARPSGTDQKFARVFLFQKVKDTAYDVYIFYINPEDGKIVLVSKRGYKETEYKKNCNAMLHKILGADKNASIREICIEKNELKTFFEWLDKDTEKILTAIKDSFKDDKKVEECDNITENDEPDRSKENLPDNQKGGDSAQSDNKQNPGQNNEKKPGQKPGNKADESIKKMMERIHADDKAYPEFVKFFKNVYNQTKNGKSYAQIFSILNSKFNNADKK